MDAATQWEISDYARWFAVPCRACFPDAPPPGHTWTCRDCDVDGCDGHYAQAFLGWQAHGEVPADA